MTHRLCTIIIKAAHRVPAFCLTLMLIVFAGAVFAHGGFDHVMGTVVKVDHNVLTVKTAKGDVDVTLNDKTEITKGGQKAQAADLKPGTRVVVDVPEGSKERVAHSVKVGMAGAASAPAHGHHD